MERANTANGAKPLGAGVNVVKSMVARNNVNHAVHPILASSGPPLLTSGPHKNDKNKNEINSLLSIANYC